MAETGKGGADKSASMRVDTALVRELAELLSANDLNEIEVEDGERKIKVRRDAPHAFVAAPAPMAAVPAALPCPKRVWLYNRWLFSSIPPAPAYLFASMRKPSEALLIWKISTR